MKNILLFLFSFIVFANTISAQAPPQPEAKAPAASCCSPTDGNCHTARPDAIAPIGVMGDHNHRKGGLMFSYRTMYMEMEGMLNGSTQATNAAVFEKYMNLPMDMPMIMQMAGVMYAATDRLTLMLMGNYLSSEMELLSRTAVPSSHTASGWGDTRLSALYALLDNGNHNLLLNGGVSAPTGSVDESMEHRMADGSMHNMVLPYAMQTGSGTWDALLGATYTGNTARYSWGVQFGSVIRTGKNTAGYTLGNQYNANSWLAVNGSSWWSLSLRVAAGYQEQINGADTRLNGIMLPPADATNTGGTSVQLLPGMNFLIPTGALSGLRLGIEYGLPVWQEVNGLQMARHSVFTAGIRYSVF